MVSILEAMLAEFGEEAVTTRRVLDRIPADKLAWKPHPKSMSLGQLAMHVAGVPGNLSRVVQAGEFDISQANPEPPMPASKDEILATWDRSVGVAEDC
ncbi:MAG TPA: DinB family protein, partial [Candidatus Acidoferrales bacterium]|nr:DinB family protein [Candidatus Acidoferrales bacterium]